MFEIRNNILPEHIYYPFLENDGVSFGPPADEETAFRELTRMQEEKSARYIAFGWHSYWWFDIYPRFTEHLRNNPVLESEDVMIYKLD